MYSSATPGITTTTNPKRMALDDVQQSALVRGGPITIASGTTDPGNTGQTNTLRPGTVLAAKSNGEFVLANDVQAISGGSVATIRSAEAPDTGWVSKVLTLFRNGVQVAQVTAGGADDTVGEWVTLLNGDQAFAANAVASADTELVITDILGRGDALRVEVNLETAYANAFDSAGGSSNDSSYNEAVGALPDVRVLLEEVTMVDANGTAQSGHSSDNAWSGIFDTDQLVCGSSSGIPASARGVLLQRGSDFR